MVDVRDRLDAAVVPQKIRDHWWVFLIEGLVLMLLGIGAVLVPVVASVAVTIFLGWLFLIGGIVGGIGMGLLGTALPILVKERWAARPAFATGAYATGITVGG